MCASNAPTPIITSVDSSNRSAHSSLNVPADWSDVYVFVYKRSVNPVNNGSSELKKPSGGKPPNASDHSPLCPAEQRPRFISRIFLPPVNRKGTQSQCSTHE